MHQGNTDPIAVVKFEDIISNCVKSARDKVDGRNPHPPRNAEEWQAYCNENMLERGVEIGQEAEACAKAEMANRGREDEIACDQPYAGSPTPRNG